LLARKHSLRRTEECAEEIELSRGKFYLVTTWTDKLPLCGEQRPPHETENSVVSANGRLKAAAEAYPNTSKKLFISKWLSDVVGSAKLETYNLIGFIETGTADDDDRNCKCL
jgi:hypothetical protein